MGSKSSRGGKGGGSGVKAAQNVEKQAPTKSRILDNMNEAQIDQEIAAARRVIARADKIMNQNDITNTPEARAWREAFPLGAGGSGWTEARKRARNAMNERDATKAAAYTKAYEDKQAALTRIEKFEKAKKSIAGTGKTVRQAREDRIKVAENAPKSIQWKTSKQGNTKVYEAGDMKITHQSGGFFLLHNKGKVYHFDKLKTAQAAAERLKK